MTLVAVALIDPRLAATFARLSFLAIGGVGGVVTLFLAMRGQDRALSLVPTWMLLLVWMFAAGMTLQRAHVGRRRRFQPHCRARADRRADRLHRHSICIPLGGAALCRRADGDCRRGRWPSTRPAPAVWEWNVRRDEIKVSPEIEIILALKPGELSTKIDDFIKHVHPTDQERFRVMLMSAQERSGGKIKTRLPSAARRQQLPLVRSRGRQCARTQTAEPCAVWACCAMSRTPSARTSVSCMTPCTAVSRAFPIANFSSTG